MPAPLPQPTTPGGPAVPAKPPGAFGEAVVPKPLTIQDGSVHHTHVPEFGLSGRMTQQPLTVGGVRQPGSLAGYNFHDAEQANWMMRPSRREWFLGGERQPPIGPAEGLPKSGPGPVAGLKQSNQRTEPSVTPEDQVMIEKVAAPAFFAKIAADTGVTPHDAETADQLRLLGDRVVSGVEAYRAKLASAAQAQTNRLVKVAAEAVGLSTPQPAPPAAPDFLADGEVYAAAAGLLAKAAQAVEPELSIQAPKPAEQPAA